MKPAKLRYLLRIVWELGPCPNRDIAREAGMRPNICYRLLYSLTQHGLVRHASTESYDLTPEGLRQLNKTPKNLRQEPTLFE